MNGGWQCMKPTALLPVISFRKHKGMTEQAPSSLYLPCGSLSAGRLGGNRRYSIRYNNRSIRTRLTRRKNLPTASGYSSSVCNC